MLSERVQAIEELFQRVLAHSAERERRMKYLAQECGDDEDLRRRVEQLLEAHERAGEFLVDPTVGSGKVEEMEALEVSSKIGNYKILQKIGEGGYGLVFMAEQMEPVHRKVALKILKLGMDTKQVIARFEAERQALALMVHPNIATIFDAGQTESGRPYFVMELVPGIPITEFCDKSRLDTQRRLELFIEVCSAVQHAHQKGIIHRDLKPSNVLITLRDGEPVPKVIDFGIAKATQMQLTDKTLFTEFRQFVGTPAYVSPEQAEMSALDVDTRTDIYSLGVLLYELLTGTTPFDSSQLRQAGLGEMQRIIRDEEPPMPSTRVNAMTAAQQTTLAQQRNTESARLSRVLCGDLDWIVMKAMEKERAQRYISAADLARDIGRFLQDEPVEATPPTISYRLQKFARRCRRQKGATMMAAVAVVIFFAGIIGVFWQWQRAEREAARATGFANQETQHRKQIEAVASEMELQRAEDLLANDHVDEGLAYLAWVARKDPGNRNVAERLVSALTYRSFALPALRSLNHKATVSAVAWSSDGESIATASDDKTVALWDARSGTKRVELLHQEVPMFVRISADSERILTATSAGARIWNAKTGEPLSPVLSGAEESRLLWADFSPDGNRFVVTYTNHSAVVFDGVTGKRINSKSIRERSNIFMARFSGDGSKLVTASRNIAQIWDPYTGEHLGAPLAGRASFKAVDVSVDGGLILAGGYGNRGRIWNAESGDQIPFSFVHTDVVEWVRFSPNGRLALTCSRDGVAQLWNTENGRQWLEPLQHRSQVVYGDFSPDGKRILTFGRDNALSIWSTESGERITEPVRLPRAITSAAFHPDGEAIVVGSHDGAAYVFEIAPRSAVPLAIGTNVYTAKFDRAGKRIVTGSSSGEVQVWDVRSGRKLDRGGMQLDNWVNDVAFSADSNWIAAGARDGTAAVWDATSGEILFTPTRGARISTISFSPDGQLLAAARFDGTADVWDALTGEPAVRLPLRHGKRIWRAYFSSDGRFLGTASSDRTARIWDASSGQPVTAPLIHNDEVLWLKFSPDCSRMITGSLDHSARVWIVSSGELVHEVHHKGPVIRAAVSPDGGRFVTASWDHTAVIWDMQSGSPISQPMRHGAAVHNALFSDDGSRVVTCSLDGTVRLWDGYSGKPVSEPLRHSSGVASVQLHGNQILSKTAQSDAALWTLFEVPSPLPPWMANLAEAIAGKRLNDQGLFDLVPIDALIELRERGSGTSDSLHKSWSLWWDWFFADHRSRTIAPNSPVMADPN